MSSSKEADRDQRRLPTLDDVLSKRSNTPVCLYSYRLFLQHRHHTVENLLFYLHVKEHEQLYRRFRRQQKRSRAFSTSDASTLVTLTSGGKETEVDKRDSRQTNQSADGGDVITQQELLESAERIYHRFIVPGSTQEVNLPLPVRQRIQNDIDINKRSDAEIFAPAKEFVFAQMEQHSFPEFLKSRSRRNLTVLHGILRLALGLFALFCGFAVALSLIFLDRIPWSMRLWGIIPIWIGVYNILVGVTELCPLMVLIGNVSEMEFFRFGKIREDSVRRLLIRRSLLILIASIFITVVLMVVLCVVPGKRL
ncbi:uncharacterized protein VTP21DRAFT_5435 [Calcarisporiella thermophila]|uniref:uncharacterized protein n=1 Tax=Calcarisporiella thermophila TaxID=911321 RepID=UPI00374360F4